MTERLRWTSAVLAVALIGTACTSADGGANTSLDAASGGALTDAANLRAALVQALGEHVMLAATATGHALAGRTEEFTAAAATLEANSHDIAEALAAPLGKSPSDVFELWDSHIRMVVRYTQATARGNTKAQNKQVDNLLAYAATIGTVIGSATGLPAETVEELVVMHITSLKTVIDAQADGDLERAGRALREAYAHMDMIAAPLADAIAS